MHALVISRFIKTDEKETERKRRERERLDKRYFLRIVTQNILKLHETDVVLSESVCRKASSRR